ncbi:MAG: hypothetical protein J3R72DRAFT_24442 [Linnemannia gamsii]|nr:MAG: hypothetical protein J3R72DRAFT_24442 [Linnemannia gamsii]
MHGLQRKNIDMKRQCTNARSNSAPLSIQDRQRRWTTQKHKDWIRNKTRMSSDTAFLEWMQKDNTLRLMKATRYAPQRIHKTRPNHDPRRTRSRSGQTLHGRDPPSRLRRRIFTSTASLAQYWLIPLRPLAQYWLIPLRPLVSVVMILDSANSIPRLQQR